MKRKSSRQLYSPRKQQRTAAPVVRKELVDYRIVRGPKMDYKVCDDAAFGAVTTTGTIYVLHQAMTQGTNWINQYVGRSVDLQGVDVRYEWVGAEGTVLITGDITNKCRVIIFQWMDDAAPTPALILQQSATGFSPLSPINIVNYENINVLHDAMYSTYLQINTNTASSSNAFTKRVYIKKKKLRPIDFNNTTGGTSKGGVFMLVVTDSSVTPNPTFAFYSRLTFTDA